VHSATQFSCDLPMQPPGMGTIHLRIAEQIYSSAVLTLTVLPSVSTLIAAPLIVGSTGGCSISINGLDPNPSDLICEFAQEGVVTKTLLSSKHTCVTPRLSPSISTLLSIVYNDVWISTEPLNLIVVLEPLVVVISPTIGTLTGGTIVTLSPYMARTSHNRIECGASSGVNPLQPLYSLTLSSLARSPLKHNPAGLKSVCP
jgi:hypothetical protein